MVREINDALINETASNCKRRKKQVFTEPHFILKFLFVSSLSSFLVCVCFFLSEEEKRDAWDQINVSYLRAILVCWAMR